MVIPLSRCEGGKNRSPGRTLWNFLIFCLKIGFLFLQGNYSIFPELLFFRLSELESLNPENLSLICSWKSLDFSLVGATVTVLSKFPDTFLKLTELCVVLPCVSRLESSIKLCEIFVTGTNDTSISGSYYHKLTYPFQAEAISNMTHNKINMTHVCQVGTITNMTH